MFSRELSDRTSEALYCYLAPRLLVKPSLTVGLVAIRVESPFPVLARCCIVLRLLAPTPDLS